jgi:hypothetical protein
MPGAGYHPQALDQAFSVRLDDMLTDPFAHSVDNGECAASGMNVDPDVLVVTVQG